MQLIKNKYIMAVLTMMLIFFGFFFINSAEAAYVSNNLKGRYVYDFENGETYNSKLIYELNYEKTLNTKNIFGKIIANPLFEYNLENKTEDIKLNEEKRTEIIKIKDKIEDQLSKNKFKNLNYDFIKDRLYELLNNNNVIELFAFFDKKGKTIIDLVSNKVETENTTGLEKKHRTWFNKIIEGKDYYISDPYYSSVTEKPCITLSLPIKKDGELKAVLATDIQISN